MAITIVDAMLLLHAITVWRHLCWRERQCLPSNISNAIYCSAIPINKIENNFLCLHSNNSHHACRYCCAIAPESPVLTSGDKSAG